MGTSEQRPGLLDRVRQAAARDAVPAAAAAPKLAACLLWSG